MTVACGRGKLGTLPCFAHRDGLVSSPSAMMGVRLDEQNRGASLIFLAAPDGRDFLL